MSRTRLILWSIALVVVAGFGLLAYLITLRVQSSVQQGSRIVLGDFAQLLRLQVEDELQAQRDPRLALSQFWDSPAASALLAEGEESTAAMPSLYAAWFNERGEVLWTNFALLEAHPQGLGQVDGLQPVRGLGEVLAGQKPKSSAMWKPSKLDSEVLVTTAVLEQDGEVIGAVSVFQETERMESFIQIFRNRLLLAVAMIGSGVTLFVYLVARWLLEPMRRLTEWARQVGEGQRVALPRLGSGQRARQLGRELEEMRLALDGRRELAAYARQVTHELKSPLTGIRAASELLTHENLPSDRRASLSAALEHEVERSERVLDSLHQLSQLEEMEALGDAQELDFLALVAACVQKRQALAQLRGVSLRWRAPNEPARVCGEARLLEGAIDNLLENALDFSSPDSQVEVSVAREKDGWLLQILDEGQGLPEYALEQVFERFYSLRGEQQGGKSSGLGLTLVRQTAELHGGWVSLENREDRQEGGAVARFWLPNQADHGK